MVCIALHVSRIHVLGVRSSIAAFLRLQQGANIQSGFGRSFGLPVSSNGHDSSIRNLFPVAGEESEQRESGDQLPFQFVMIEHLTEFEGLNPLALTA